MKKALITLAISAVVCTVASVLWFSPIRGHSFVGDDLIIITRYQHGELATNLLADILSTPDDKFRPIANPVIGIAVRSCGFNFDCYENVNLVWYILNGVLFGFIVYELTRKWALAGILSILIYVFSRFSSFFIVQVYGLMENAGITFVLLYGYAVARYLRDRKASWFWLAFAAAILATGAHERFIVLVAPLYVLPFLVLDRQKPMKILGMDAVVTLFPAGYIALRMFLLHIPIFVGTGGTLVTNTFRLRSFFSLIAKGWLTWWD
jgi:hypothetical protein